MNEVKKPGFESRRAVGKSLAITSFDLGRGDYTVAQLLTMFDEALAPMPLLFLEENLKIGTSEGLLY